ncbi:putative membrane protein [Lacibacter cauensis]|uniref:Putative membrane protein n=1 Tax=Lacibacter cauensis TaxID=510947 RepID=A0A562SHG3_9BACT|nr:DUF2306 domain-containing protein [Lacibacter cauensis]TWI80210.1 putative membrane protein [Lacibacter cauensis]
MFNLLHKYKLLRYLLLPVYAYFCWLMLRITMQYIPFNRMAAFLQIKQTEVQELPYYIPVFYTHVYSSIFCLLAGFTQFSNTLRQQYVRLHRVVGLLYVAVVLVSSAPSGFVMALHANGGVLAVVFFVMLSLLWWWFTFRAVVAIKQKNIARHEAFMIRSFALALSAITLRLWKVILVYLFAPAPMDVYVIVAGLGWIPNLLIAEYIIKRKLI